jgi:hypothetical protein
MAAQSVHRTTANEPDQTGCHAGPLEALDFIIFEPLSQVAAYFSRIGEKLKAFLTTLFRATRGIGEVEKAAAAAALTRFLMGVLEGLEAAVAVDLVEFLSAVAAGIGLAVFVDVMVCCLARLGV